MSIELSQHLRDKNHLKTIFKPQVLIWICRIMIGHLFTIFFLRKKNTFISFHLFLTGPRSGILVRCQPFQPPIFLLNDDRLCEKHIN